MYSKNMRSGSSEEALPPRYSGVRFRKERRADGRDFVVEAPLPVPVQKEIPDGPKTEQERRREGGLSDLLRNIRGDDLLLAALIIILAGEGEDSREAVLLLLLLLCVR